MKALIDCNNFYCACERLFRPDLKNKPIVVLSNNDGCVISRSDEAKSLGISMAAPYFVYREMMQKNNVSAFSSNYSLYGDLSLRVMDTLRLLAGYDKVEVYSVDEAFIDLDEVPADQLHEFVCTLRSTIEEWIGINVSIGVAPTKVLAKVANKLAKKDKENTRCIMVLETREKLEWALEQTPVEEIWGIGKRYALKLEKQGLENALSLSRMPEEWARTNLGGVVGVRMIRELNGEACIQMKDPLETKKMISTTRMFGRPVTEIRELREAVATYTSRAAEKLRRQNCVTACVDVYLVTNGKAHSEYRYDPKTMQTHVKLERPTAQTQELLKCTVPLVDRLFQPGMKYTKAGVILSSLTPDNFIQASMFEANSGNENKELMQVVDNINFSMRDDAIRYASSGIGREWKMKQEMKSKRFTTRFDELFRVS